MTDVLDHGYVNLVDSMGDDLAIVNAARTSYNNPSGLHFLGCDATLDGDCTCGHPAMYKDNQPCSLAKADRGLINFLAKHRHGTPFEMVTLKFEVQAPIFVFREWHRHRVASINEMSGRYVELPRLFYVPDVMREQHGKPGSYTYDDMQNADLNYEIREDITYTSNRSFDAYESMLLDGVAKEHARIVLPLNTYSKMVWACNLRALFNFLSLRNHDRAQMEIRVYAEAIEQMVMEVAPVAMAAFVSNGRQAP